jgi:hypothetical protein
VTPRELLAQKLIAESGVALDDYAFGSRSPVHRTDLDVLRTVRDPVLRQQAWDLYWLMRAERVEHSRPREMAPPRHDGEDPRYP